MDQSVFPVRMPDREGFLGPLSDRLKEEKDRGLTIDLGFARIKLADGRLLGLVDVPGHERFVRNMVAGSTGLDLAMLIVAADDGVMPQTVEHVDILDGRRRGVTVQTVPDLGTNEPGADPTVRQLERRHRAQHANHPRVRHDPRGEALFLSRHRPSRRFRRDRKDQR